MRKRVINESQDKTEADEGWLDVERAAVVEVTSEDVAHPVEAALLPEGKGGWRATHAGPQTIRLIFDAPQRLSRIRLVFAEEESARTQEFVLRWAASGGQPAREIVRQQFTFSPPGTNREVEDYRVELDGVRAIELTITPDINGGEARASLAQLRLA
jgi:hypothetical protein